MCDQHIRDDDNSYKELEFDRVLALEVNQAKNWSKDFVTRKVGWSIVTPKKCHG